MCYIPRSYKFNKIFLNFSQSLQKKQNLKKHSYGIYSTSYGILTNSTLEVLRRALSKYLRYNGKVVRKVFLTVPCTKKSKNSRMGKGRGDLNYWFLFVKPGLLLFEFFGNAENLRFMFNKTHGFLKRLPFKCRFCKLIYKLTIKQKQNVCVSYTKR